MKIKSAVNLACTSLILGASVSFPALAQQSDQPRVEHAREHMETTIVDNNEEMDRVASDAWKEGKLETVYLFNRHLNNFTIDSEVRGNSVVLTGNVESEVDKALAEQLAMGIEGIDMVTNRLAITSADEARTTRSDDDVDFSQMIEDATLTAEIKTKLFANGETGGFQINVDTERNAVTLSGTVDSSAEKDLAGEIAGMVEGVASVRNNLQVSR